MLRKLTALAVAAGFLFAGPALAESTQAPLKHVNWSFSGPFGKYDQAQLQRGFKVYREVCSQCHALNLIAFHDLGEPGGPFWSPKYPNANENPWVKAIAANYKAPDIDTTTGDTIQRPATSADHIPAPYANDTAAKATLGGAPPDMSLLVKAREGGPDYVYSIVSTAVVTPGAPTVTAYAPTPAGLTVPAGKYYHPYLMGDLSSSWTGKGPPPVGGIIAMPPPLADGKVTFDDGTKSTIDQEAQDVAAFLQWASDPKMEERKQLGLSVMIYLLIFTGLLYASYRRIWRDVGH
ncbi:MAG TPA: cytochrome c1 [Caulobacteraceae bacterium]|jgi:ubiquinol-cytochrome c reductase cytochrome c1 subunit